ncbi:MAG TPA: LptF/LptG family permease [Tepidisphaeraceae bacterium]|jgi:lipopolysaccharide export LptBFGC system permease protein LptF|nr:LptF/LptG family permease [Tepidisphaeraceae bacterium]
MSRTLFWYIFKDLVRIFFMASGVLAGIMSFGGLLRPLTEHGLSMGQVTHMLAYFQPPMTAYSLPIAALFATTIVYGRLSADNEIVACRSAGISHLAMAAPAFVLGLSVAILGLLLLCFIVPIFMLKAEKVLFSNVGQIIANEVERTHQIKMEQEGQSVTVFAQGAKVVSSDADHPEEQVVLLIAPMFVQYESNPDKSSDAIQTPKNFYIARQATVRITQDLQTDELAFTARLQGGIEFPRIATGMEGGTSSSDFAARSPSLVRENTKFMDVWRLKELLNDESSSTRVRRILNNFVAAEQKQIFLKTIADALSGEESLGRMVSGNQSIVIMRGKAATDLQEGKLVVGAGTPDVTRPVRVFQEENGQALRTFEAQAIEITVIPDDTTSTMHARVDLSDAMERIGDSVTPHVKYPLDFDVPMTDTIRQLPTSRTSKYYLKNSQIFPGEVKTLQREQTFVFNTVRSELHGRVSFAVSCFILVMVGCALGMMFRSGNFLSAFALSVVPALICIALIITGQHTCENVPHDLGANFHNPFELGRNLIWSGNAAVAVIAVVLLGRLQRQ